MLLLGNFALQPRWLRGSTSLNSIASTLGGSHTRIFGMMVGKGAAGGVLGLQNCSRSLLCPLSSFSARGGSGGLGGRRQLIFSWGWPSLDLSTSPNGQSGGGRHHEHWWNESLWGPLLVAPRAEPFAGASFNTHVHFGSLSCPSGAAGLASSLTRVRPVQSQWAACSEGSGPGFGFYGHRLEILSSFRMGPQFSLCTEPCKSGSGF